MKNFIKNLLLASIMMLSHQLYGNHAGGFINYSYAGVDSFHVRFTVFNNCDGPSLPVSAVICISSVSSGISFTSLLTQTGPPIDVPPNPSLPPVVNSCYGGNFMGFTRNIFEGLIVLPAAANDWIISKSQNNALGNYPYVYTRINNLDYPTNSSVSFFDSTKFVYCVNEPAWASFAAVDPDGDSIVYSFDSLLVDTVDCPPSPSVSTINIDQPVTSSSTYFIDSNAGWIYFNPVVIEVGSICIKASEYRMQTLINETTYMLNMYSYPGCVLSNQPDLGETNEINFIHDFNKDVIMLPADQSTGSAILRIYDITGRLVITEGWQNIQSDKEVSLHMITSGMYFISATINQSNQQEVVKSGRFIKR
jgi:Secretion system C-terminal sorting domain